MDEILVRQGMYASREDLICDALRALLRAKPRLRSDLAVELYRRGSVSLSFEGGRGLWDESGGFQGVVEREGC